MRKNTYHGAFSEKDGLKQLKNNCVYCHKKMSDHKLYQIFNDRLREYSGSYSFQGRHCLAINHHEGEYKDIEPEYAETLVKICKDLERVAKKFYKK